jgi:hypothetical protein
VLLAQAVSLVGAGRSGGHIRGVIRNIHPSSRGISNGRIQARRAADIKSQPGPADP